MYYRPRQTSVFFESFFFDPVESVNWMEPVIFFVFSDLGGARCRGMQSVSSGQAECALLQSLEGWYGWLNRLVMTPVF